MKMVSEKYYHFPLLTNVETEAQQVTGKQQNQDLNPRLLDSRACAPFLHYKLEI